MPPHVKRSTLIFLFGVWVILLSTGIGFMMRQEGQAGAAGNAPQSWPEETCLHRGSGIPTLLMFAHPKCSCTRASLDELQALLDDHRESLSVYVVLFRPAETAEDWTQTSLWRRAAAIPGLKILDDPEGKEAARFGSATSGDVLVYNAGGRLTFHGGITAARGHAGPNAGADALTRLMEQRALTRTRTPVFGCSLFSPP